MCKITLLTILISFFIFTRLAPVFAQEDNHTAREEIEGKAIWERLQNKQASCDNLSDDDFGALGEYYMGQMMGTSHEQMNQMMIQMMGEEGEKQMHISMGKRLSGCDTSAQFPQNEIGFMPMMWMMGSAFSRWPSGFDETKGGDNSMMGQGFGTMMNGWGGFGIFGWLSMFLFWALLILGVIALIRYLARSGQEKKDRTPLDILKERYAKGQIDKKEFEEKKKDL
ncbi:MAG TPA: SHOCT domain-containing protein [Patescibacteria group bacterium]|nr:SHOCT domain-containing protein [Patescibacteria group bacterium]